MRLTALLLAAFFLQPPATEIRLIVKGDDMGAAHGINVGTIAAYKGGVLTTTNVIVPGPWFLEAAKLLRDNPGLDVGVHLALTSEWDHVKWRPLTHAPSIVDEGMPRKRLRASAELRISVVRITSRLGSGSADSARS